MISLHLFDLCLKKDDVVVFIATVSERQLKQPVEDMGYLNQTPVVFFIVRVVKAQQLENWGVQVLDLREGEVIFTLC